MGIVRNLSAREITVELLNNTRDVVSVRPETWQKIEYASKSGLAAAEAAGAINPVVEEANKKIMSFCAFEHDPLFEDEMLKGVGTGVYQQVFDTMDYDNAPSEELVDLLLDGLESVGYIV